MSGAGSREPAGAPLPSDRDLLTPQGGGAGTGAFPVGMGGGEGRRWTLPQVEGKPGSEAPERPAGKTPSVAIPERKEVGPLRLLLTLTVAGALAGSILVFVYLWSQPRILAYRAQVLREAVLEVLHHPHEFESLFVVQGKLVPAAQVPAGLDTTKLDRVFLGYDESRQPVGFAMEAEGFGFQDVIALIFGYDPATNRVLGMKVLRHLETPGLGDKIVKDSAFVSEFRGAEALLEGVKPDRNTGAANQVDMITGATISSRAVIRIINERISAMKDLLTAYGQAGASGGRGSP